MVTSKTRNSRVPSSKLNIPDRSLLRGELTTPCNPKSFEGRGIVEMLGAYCAFIGKSMME